MKVTEITRPVDRKFNVELNEQELKIITILLGFSSNSSFEELLTQEQIIDKKSLIEYYNYNSTEMYRTLFNSL